jgi:hypothetical protein
LSQLDLFSRSADAVPNVHTPEPDNIRLRLSRILDEARQAESMPWERSKELMYRNIFPQMTNWLPRDEAEAFKAEFTAELTRLAAA